MAERDTSDVNHMIEAYFEAARSETAAPSADLMARVLSDAQEVQAGLMAPPDRAIAYLSGLRYALRALGGWPAVAGLATVTVAGVWIGATQPDAVVSYASFLQQDTALYQVDLSDSVGFDVDEGTL